MFPDAEITAPTRIVIVRAAVPADMEELLRMARAFHAAGSLPCFPELDEASFHSFVGRLAGSGDSVLLVAERKGGLCGMAAAIAYPVWWNSMHATGQEVFWWVDPEARGGGAGVALLDALEAWARGIGLTTFSMVALDKLDPRVGALYRARGYAPQETVYTKGVG